MGCGKRGCNAEYYKTFYPMDAGGNGLIANFSEKLCIKHYAEELEKERIVLAGYLKAAWKMRDQLCPTMRDKYDLFARNLQKKPKRKS